MVTGDGLLVRLHPTSGRLTADQTRLIARAALAHGNGHLDITARGNLQIRGVREETYPALFKQLDDAGLAEPEGDGPPRLTVVSPLAGLDPQERFDARTLAGSLESRVETDDLPAKFFIAVDGGGLMPLDELGADLHLHATGEDGPHRVAIGLASPQGMRWIGTTSSTQVLEISRTIVEGFARMRQAGRTSARRIRDLERVLVDELVSEAALCPAVPPPSRAAIHRAGTINLGEWDAVLLALPFGRCTAHQMEQAARWSEEFGSGELRLSFTRAILLPGISVENTARLLSEAQQSGFIVDGSDRRLLFQACAGKPACASAQTSVAEDAARLAGSPSIPMKDGMTVHVSGCSKGCAHPTAANLTLVGSAEGFYSVVLNGTARDVPDVTLPIEEIMTRLSSLTSPENLGTAFGRGPL
jgi:precorrin-3B synthase